MNFLCPFAVVLSLRDGCCKLIFIALLLLSHLQSSTDCVLEILLFNASHSFCFLSLGLDADLPSHLETLFMFVSCLSCTVRMWVAADRLFAPQLLLETSSCVLACVFTHALHVALAFLLQPLLLLGLGSLASFAFCFQSVLEVNALLLHSWGWLCFLCGLGNGSLHCAQTACLSTGAGVSTSCFLTGFFFCCFRECWIL